MEIKVGDIIFGKVRTIPDYITLVGKVTGIQRRADILEEYKNGKFVEIKRWGDKIYYIVEVLFSHPQNEYTLSDEYNLTEREIERYKILG